MGKYCCVCDKALGFFTDKTALKDGYVCKKCLKEGGMKSLSSGDKLSAEQVANIIASRVDKIQNFRATKQFGKLEIDMVNQLFKIDDNCYLFSDLYSYSYHEYPNNARAQDQEGKTSGAVIGGVIGGLGGSLVGSAIGAAVGGKIGSMFLGSCEYMYINITLKDALESDIRLDYIREKTRVSSSEYKYALKEAEACLDGLQIIVEQNAIIRREQEELRRRQYKKEEPLKTERTVYIQSKHYSADELASELTTLKSLLYAGEISQEEYEQKKKQLLSLM